MCVLCVFVSLGIACLSECVVLVCVLDVCVCGHPKEQKPRFDQKRKHLHSYTALRNNKIMRTKSDKACMMTTFTHAMIMACLFFLGFVIHTTKKRQGPFAQWSC